MVKKREGKPKLNHDDCVRELADVFEKRGYRIIVEGSILGNTFRSIDVSSLFPNVVTFQFVPH
jgi:hypothetical protein